MLWVFFFSPLFILPPFFSKYPQIHVLMSAFVTLLKNTSFLLVMEPHCLPRMEPGPFPMSRTSAGGSASPPAALPGASGDEALSQRWVLAVTVPVTERGGQGDGVSPSGGQHSFSAFCCLHLAGDGHFVVLRGSLLPLALPPQPADIPGFHNCAVDSLPCPGAGALLTLSRLT